MFYMMVVNKVDMIEKGCGLEICGEVVGGRCSIVLFFYSFIWKMFWLVILIFSSYRILVFIKVF